ncbi:hypothetical protein ACLKA7_012718 [Drosophila subpalustris]
MERQWMRCLVWSGLVQGTGTGHAHVCQLGKNCENSIRSFSSRQEQRRSSRCREQTFAAVAATRCGGNNNN